MAGDNRLQIDPLFQGLARPAMILGVSYTYFVLNGTLTLVSYIGTSDWTLLFVIGPLIHVIGYLICLREPRAIELLMVKMSKGLTCLNRRFHGNTNSYDVY